MSSKIIYVMSFFRWGHTPIQEAERENRRKVVEYLSAWDGRGNEVDFDFFVV